MEDEQLSEPHRGAIKTDVLPPSKINLGGLKKIFSLMERKLGEVEEDEVDRIYNSLPIQTQDNLDKEQLYELQKVWVEVTSENGEYHIYYNSDDLEEGNLPAPIKTIKFHSWPELDSKNLAVDSDHSITVNLDFSSEDWLDLSLARNTQGYQQSYIQVSGSQNTWVKGTYAEIFEIFENQKFYFRGWLHKGNNYNFLVLFFGIPFAIWVGYTAENYLSEVTNLSGIIHTSIVIYTILASISLIRISFNIFRNLFPYFELPLNHHPALKLFRWLFGMVVALITVIGFFI